MASILSANGESYPLTTDSVTIGRGPGNFLTLQDDRKVSRSHLELRLSDGQWTLVDLSSRNGTLVNRRPVVHCSLRDGDQIQVGDTTLRFVIENDENETEIGGSANSTTVLPDLSDREREVLVLIAQGLTDKDIGERLVISTNTVRSHLDRIKGKTGLRRRSELTRLALEMRIV
jgi:DNA-binding CsgD family transcriptional regulator